MRTNYGIHGDAGPFCPGLFYHTRTKQFNADEFRGHVWTGAHFASYVGRRTRVLFYAVSGRSGDHSVIRRLSFYL